MLPPSLARPSTRLSLLVCLVRGYHGRWRCTDDVQRCVVRRRCCCCRVLFATRLCYGRFWRKSIQPESRPRFVDAAAAAAACLVQQSLHLIIASASPRSYVDVSVHECGGVCKLCRGKVVRLSRFVDDTPCVSFESFERLEDCLLVRRHARARSTSCKQLSLSAERDWFPREAFARLVRVNELLLRY